MRAGEFRTLRSAAPGSNSTGVPLKPVISSISKKLVLNGLPTTSCMTVESPMKPAGGIDTRVSHCRKFGPIRLPASEA